MNGLEFGVGLVAHGNYWLESGSIDPIALGSLLSRRVHGCRFVGESRTLESPLAWLEYVREMGDIELRLMLDPRPRDLETVVEHGLGASPMWAPYIVSAQGDRVWHVSRAKKGRLEILELAESRTASMNRPPTGDLSAAESELGEALEDALNLCSERGDEDWYARLIGPRRRWEQSTPDFPKGMGRIWPEGYGSPERRALLYTAMDAYIFGEGGWCEWPGSPSSRRSELARAALNLYVATLTAIEAAVNAE